MAMDVRASGARVARTPQFGWLASAGLAARGAIYVIVAILAIELALGAGGKATNQQGALKTLAHQPFGKVLLIVMAIGLAAYALWRLVRAAVGHGREESDDFKERIGALGAGIGYGGLCFTAIKILAGSGGGNSGHPDKAAAGVLGWPAGPWLVGIAGAVVIVIGGDQLLTGFKQKFLEHSKTEQMSPAVRRAFTWLGVFGHVARGIVFALVGWFLIKAAIDFDPHKAIGLDGALAKLRHAGYGPALLGAVAAGLLGFGLYSLADARYRRA